VADLTWFKTALLERNGEAYFSASEKMAFTVFKSDASGNDSSGVGAVGWGAHCGSEAIFSRWSPGSADGHASLMLELIACRESLAFFGPKCRGHWVLAGLDNSGAAQAINKGRCPNNGPANRVIAQIFDLVYEYDLELSAVWTPREFNTAADELSKSAPSDLEQMGASRVATASFPAHVPV
jgi:hypothetical protein